MKPNNSGEDAMDHRRKRPLILLIGMALVYVSLGSTPLVAAKERVLPMPGERIVTKAEKDAIKEHMTAGEQEALGALLGDEAGLLVAYVSRSFDIVERDDGTTEFVELGAGEQNPNAALRLPRLSLAASSSATREDLRITLAVVRTRTTSPYEWQIAPYAEWNGIGGAGLPNGSEDSFGVAWHGGMYLYSDTPSGRYWCSSAGVAKPLDIYRSDVAANLGVGYSFHEWKRVCSANYATLMDFGWSDVRIRENTWKNDTANAVMKYFHTTGGLTYSLGFSATGPSVTISPSNEQWSLATYVTFTY